MIKGFGGGGIMQTLTQSAFSEVQMVNDSKDFMLTPEDVSIDSFCDCHVRI